MNKKKNDNYTFNFKNGFANSRMKNRKKINKNNLIKVVRFIS